MNRKNTACLLIALVGFVLQGCASVETSISMTRLESPETRGDTLKFDGELGYGSTTDIQVVSDASLRPPAFNSPAVLSTGGELFGRFTLDVLPWLDIDVRDGVFANVPLTLTIKAQIVGHSSRDSKGGDFSLALAGTGGGTTEFKNGSQDGTFGPGGYPWNTDLTTTMQSFAVILGYRLNSALLLYGGGFRDTYYASGTIHQGASDNGQSLAAQYSIGGNALNLGGNLDLEIALSNTRSALLTFEIVHSTVTWVSSQSLSPTVAGGSLHIRF